MASTSSRQVGTVDVATGWVECIGVWGKGQQRVCAAVHRIRQRLPFTLLGLDSDNGSEFINHHLATYCTQEGITFTRSRPYKKNDSAHVESRRGGSPWYAAWWTMTATARDGLWRR